MLGVPTHSPDCVMLFGGILCCTGLQSETRLSWLYRKAAAAAHLTARTPPRLYEQSLPSAQVLSIFNYPSETPGLDPRSPGSLPHFIKFTIQDSVYDDTVR